MQCAHSQGFVSERATPFMRIKNITFNRDFINMFIESITFIREFTRLGNTAS